MEERYMKKLDTENSSQNRIDILLSKLWNVPELNTFEEKVDFISERLRVLIDIRDKYENTITFKLSYGIKYIIPDERFPHDARLLFDEMEKITKFLEEYKDII